jgi:Holliday junction resolvase RusA-like endonuclease
MALPSKVEPPKRRPVECVALDLPKPISVNRIWVTGRGRMYSSDVYIAWKREVGLLANASRAGGVRGPYALTVNVSHKWRGDLDNALKALSDALQEHGVISNDRLAQSITIRRSASVSGMSVLIVATKEVTNDV